MNILFLTDYWFPQMTANTICVQNIAEELQRTCNKVHVCAYSEGQQTPDTVEDIRFSYIRPSFARRLLQQSKHCNNKSLARLLALAGTTINRIRRLILLPFYPVVSFSVPRRWSKKVSEIVQKDKIDVVVSVIAPDEALYAGYLIKKNNPSIDWKVYYIDAGTNILTDTSFEGLKKALQNKAKKWENKMLKLASKVVVMEGHADYYRHTLSSENAKKLRIGNVPLLKIGTVSAPAQTISKNDKEKWVYTGNLSGLFYDPKPLCEFFIQYRKKHLNAELHLYGPSDHREYLESVGKIQCGIFWHGPVNHDEIPMILSSADLLVYFNCRQLDSVSGKFFEYLGYGKRILYYGSQGDINSNQIRKYNSGLVVDMNDPMEDNLRKTEEFLLKHHDSDTVDVEYLKAAFTLNLPETTAKFILS